MPVALDVWRVLLFAAEDEFLHFTHCDTSPGCVPLVCVYTRNSRAYNVMFMYWHLLLKLMHWHDCSSGTAPSAIDRRRVKVPQSASRVRACICWSNGFHKHVPVTDAAKQTVCHDAYLVGRGVEALYCLLLEAAGGGGTRELGQSGPNLMEFF